jgi:hypothetical protein
VLHQLPRGGDYLAVLSVALDPLNGERFGVWVTWFLANIALFSPIQFQNWLWPMQFAYFLPYTFLALSLWALYLPIGAGKKFALAAACALAGNYCLVCGRFPASSLQWNTLKIEGVLCAGVGQPFM